jgi:cyclase
MLTKRIIPCLDVKDGRTVKGINFVNLRDAGDPVELGRRYSEEGADELVFLDITATLEKRKTLADLASRVAAHLRIPFTIGGGVRTKADIDVLLRAGADKVSINSAALENPELLNAVARSYGSQCLVLAVDARYENGVWTVYSQGGKQKTDRLLHLWTQEAVDRGVGEILFTSMDHDGTKKGFAVDAVRQLSTSLPVPVIASGGAGLKEHFLDIFANGKADAALAASLFHFGELEIPALKSYLWENKINIRI